MCADQQHRVPADDWRRRNQEKYLRGKAFRLSRYTPPRPDWDHDHCEFCMAKLSLLPGDLAKGYHTEDDYRWICEPCFREFQDEFGWTVIRSDA